MPPLTTASRKLRCPRILTNLVLACAGGQPPSQAAGCPTPPVIGVGFLVSYGIAARALTNAGAPGGPHPGVASSPVGVGGPAPGTSPSSLSFRSPPDLK